MAITDPRTLGRFTVRRVLGEGGMGRVYLGQARDGTTAAIKVIRSDLAGDAEFRARFGHEVEAASRVRGPYIAEVLGAEPDGDPPWLATEYVPAPSLREAVVLHGPMPESAVRLLGVGLAEALTAVHAAGVVHRDMKPANVLLAESGPKVIDFGIARAADATALTRTGAVVGSPGYIAPEQITHGRSGPPADVFALGGMLLYAVTGRAPFGEGDVNALLYRTVHGEPDLTGVPGSLAPVIAACLERDPDRRPTTEQVRAMLAAGPQDRPTSGWLPSALEPTPSRPVQAGPPRWRRPALAAAVVVVAAVLVGTGIAALRSGSGGGGGGGGGGEGGQPTTSVALPTSAPAPPTSAAPPTAPPTSAAPPSPVDVAATELPASGGGFASPSGNIACFVSAETTRCDIRENDWDPTTVPPKPADCPLVWGDSIGITGSDRPDFVCHGDTVLGSGAILDYGRAVRSGDTTCTSRPTGVECKVGGSGHGFTVSKSAYQFF
ncbi:MAG: serine/threonine protein kinase [Pseudonocardia sp.]|nr:serine/threonine protein kinase [Pseudonocardia sp.]